MSLMLQHGSRGYFWPNVYKWERSNVSMLTQELNYSPWVCVCVCVFHSYTDLHPKLGKMQRVLVNQARQEVYDRNLGCLCSDSWSCKYWSEQYQQQPWSSGKGRAFLTLAPLRSQGVRWGLFNMWLADVWSALNITADMKGRKRGSWRRCLYPLSSHEFFLFPAPCPPPSSFPLTSC